MDSTVPQSDHDTNAQDAQQEQPAEQVNPLPCVEPKIEPLPTPVETDEVQGQTPNAEQSNDENATPDTTSKPNSDIVMDCNTHKINVEQQETNKLALHDAETTESKNDEQPKSASTATPQATALEASAILESVAIPEEAKKYTFGCQVLIKDLNTNTQLNNHLGFVIGDYKKYARRFPIRLITEKDQATAPVYLLKLENIQFVCPPIPGYDVLPYSDDEDDNDNDDESDTDSDSSSSSSSSSSKSSLPPRSVSNFQSMSITITKDGEQVTNDEAAKQAGLNQDGDVEAEDEDDDLKLEPDAAGLGAGVVLDDKKADENMRKYYDMLQEIHKPETIDLSPSITSTKSLPIDCGLRFEPKPITEDIESMQTEKIGTIANIINDIELVIESNHSPQTVITFDSVLCLEDKTPIGRVDDIFGNVKKPYYFVRLTLDKAMMLKDKLSVDQDIYAVQQLSQFVLPPQTDERYSSASESGDSSNDDDDDQYAPNSINNDNNNNNNNDRKRPPRAMSVDRFDGSNIVNRNRRNNNNNNRGYQSYKHRHFNRNNNFNQHYLKRQKYNTQFIPSNMPPVRAQFAPFMPTTTNTMGASAFTALPTAIPPPSLPPHQTARITPATATYFRPQVNIIPSPPKQYASPLLTNYGSPNAQSTMQTQPQIQTQSASLQSQPLPPQNQTVNTNVKIVTKITNNPFGFAKK